MLAANIRDKLLVDELQLGNSLNQAVTNGDRAYFSLLLSMISADVTDDETVVDNTKQKSSNEDLRQKFNLPPVRSFYADASDYTRSDIFNTYLEQDLVSTINLNIAMNPEPYVMEERSIAKDVINNLSPLSKRKVEYAENGLAIAREPFDLCTLQIVEVIDKARELAL